MELQRPEWRPSSIIAGIVALGWMLGSVPLCAAGLIPGGGRLRSDCYSEFDVEGVDTTANVVQCAEGADACDTDGLPNDVCDFKVALCPNQTDPNVAACTPHPPLTRLKIKGGMGKKKPSALPPAPADLSGTDKLVLVCNPSECEACCPTPNPAGGPDELRLSVNAAASDLDVGWSGTCHNFPFVSRVGLRLCLSGCDASTNPVCDATGPTGALNSYTFGPPLPLIAQGVSMCVVNVYQPGDLTAKINVQTGEIPDSNPLAVNLFSKVHLTSPSEVCPRCNGSGAPAFGAQGTCDGGPNLGQACIIDSILTSSGRRGARPTPSQRAAHPPRASWLAHSTSGSGSPRAPRRSRDRRHARGKHRTTTAGAPRATRCAQERPALASRQMASASTRRVASARSAARATRRSRASRAPEAARS